MAVISTTFLLAMPKYYVPNLVLLNKRRTTIALFTGIVIITMLTFVSVSAPKPAASFAIPCPGCGAHESITGNAIGDLACSNGISYPNTQVNFNAIVPVKIVGPAKGSVTLTATAVSQVQGMVTSGMYDPSMKTYSLSGTSTSDSACGIPGSPFTISGIIGPEVQITMGGGKYAFQGTGDVTASPAKKA
jgi:hypothetical protein